MGLSFFPIKRMNMKATEARIAEETPKIVPIVWL